MRLELTALRNTTHDLRSRAAVARVDTGPLPDLRVRPCDLTAWAAPGRSGVHDVIRWMVTGQTLRSEEYRPLGCWHADTQPALRRARSAGHHAASSSSFVA